MKISIALWIFLFFTSFAWGHKEPVAKSASIHFTKNENQWDARVLYKANLDGGSLFMEKDGFTYNLYDKEKKSEQHLHRISTSDKKNDLRIRSHAYKMQFKNATHQQEPIIEALYPGSDYSNFFIGNDPKNWAAHVNNFRQLNYKALYPKIDLEIMGAENSVKYNFIVSPHGDPSLIVMDYKGVQAPILREGRLIVKNSFTEIVEEKPYAYQQIGGKNVRVPCRFVVNGQEVSFAFEKGYNTDLPLIIDPTLIFCSYSGSTADNFGMTATYDSHGNLYAGGTAFDMGYPTTLGAYDTVYNGQVAYGRTDVVITKYDSTGSKLLYSTYIGGANGSEIVTSLIVNGQDELFLYGATGSSDFPTTKNAFSRSFKGGDTLRFMFNGTYFDQGTDIYVSKLNPGGTSLLASTLIGGSKNDGVNHNNIKKIYNSYAGLIYEYNPDSLQYNYGDQYRGEIMLDASGNCYIASSSRSPDFPILNGFDKTLGGQQDAVVLKFNQDLSKLFWSTFLGGKDNDAGYALAVDDSANVYVTGGTRSLDFPATAKSLHPFYQGGRADGYITKIKSDGKSILNSSLIGTAFYDQSYFVQLDKSKNVYLYGQTRGQFPVSAGVYSNPNSGQFILKLSNDLSTQLYSTVIGNGNGISISPSAFLVDNCENIYLSGWGGNFVFQIPTFNMPLTPNAFQKTTEGYNFYLMVLSKDVKQLVYATYFGGPLSAEHVDGGTSRFDKKGIIYQSVCAGCGGNSDLPTTPGAWSRVNKSSNCNNGTFKMDFGFRLAAANFTSTLQGCAPLLVNFKNVSSPTAKYYWSFGPPGAVSNLANPVYTYTKAGKYTARLIVIDSATCNISDTSFKFITVFPAVKHKPLTIGNSHCAAPCDGMVSITVTAGTAPFSYLWNTGQKTSTINQLCAGTYSLYITDSMNCKDSATAKILAPPPLVSSLSRIKPPCGKTCEAQAMASISGGTAPYSYQWNDPKVQRTATATKLCNGSYQLRIADANGCIKKDSIIIKYSSTYPSIHASADKDTLLEGQTTYLHVSAGYKYRFLWTPSNSLSSATDPSPIASPEATTTYKVSVEDTIDCVSRDSVTIHFKRTTCAEPEIFIPNGFSPNEDGINDVLYVRGRAIAEMYLAVYDRWGEKIFESTSPQLGWDGRYKGSLVTPAVYAYYLRVRCFNKKEFFKKGNITVIR